MWYYCSKCTHQTENHWFMHTFILLLFKENYIHGSTICSTSEIQGNRVWPTHDYTQYYTARIYPSVQFAFPDVFSFFQAHWRDLVCDWSQNEGEWSGVNVYHTPFDCLLIQAHYSVKATVTTYKLNGFFIIPLQNTIFKNKYLQTSY